MLFPIDPIGIGTSEVESLPSYVARLSQAHGVTVGQLLRYVSSQWGGIEPRSDARKRSEGNFCLVNQLAEFVRPTEVTRSLVGALNHCTGRTDLAWTTYLPIAAGLNRTEGSFAYRLKWCPACLQECKTIGIPSHHKLLWQMRDALYCEIHSVPLEIKCNECGKYQGTFRYRKSANICQECYASLDVSVNSVGLTYREHATAQDIDALLARYIEIPAIGVPADIIRRRIDTLFEWYWNQEREAEIYRKVGRDRLLAVAVGNKPITLRTVRQLAYGLSMPIVDLVCGNMAQMDLDLADTGDNEIPEYVTRKRKRRRDRDLALKTIMEVLSETDETMSLREVARRARVSTGYMRARFPMLVKSIAEERKKYQQDLVHRSTQQAIAAILEYRSATHADNPQMGEKKMITFLNKEYGISKYRLRKVWRDLREQSAY